MARQQSLAEKVAACINAPQQKKYPYPHTYDFNYGAASGAAQAAATIVARCVQTCIYSSVLVAVADDPQEGAPQGMSSSAEVLGSTAGDPRSSLRNQHWNWESQQYEATIQLTECGTPRHYPLLKGRRHPVTQPWLTRVSRQLRTETLAIFYGINVFHLDLYCGDVSVGNIEQTESLLWLTGIGPSNAQLVKHIRVIFWNEAISQRDMDRLMRETALSTVAAVAVVAGSSRETRLRASLGDRAYDILWG
ncbi:hypothetical protein LTR10_015864 [Elasticomyces elasticus]|nr:hypothetical protein LTR10_015864 [Elasticomyces elasticus]